MTATRSLALAFSLALATLASGAEALLLKKAGFAPLHVEGTLSETPFPPVSTFKIPLCLMGFDAGFLVDETLPALPFHEGYSAWIPEWKQTTTPKSWMKNSVVWYSQRLTEWLGSARFQKYIDAFEYGNRNLSGDTGADNGLTHSWLDSSLLISPRDQIGFLEKIVLRQLPVSEAAYTLTEKSIATFDGGDGWTVYGKTGSGNPDNEPFGWFIGWARKGEEALLFVYLNKDEKKEEGYAGPRARDTFLARFPKLIKEAKLF